MAVLDRSRFLFSLAGACNDGEWTVAGLRAALNRVAAGYSLRSPGLPQRVLARFPTAPGYDPLLAFLVTDVKLTRALSHHVARRTVKHRGAPKMEPPPARMGALDVPPLATEAALAEWLRVDPCRLRWLADLTGRNRKHPAGPLRTYRHRWVKKPGGRARLLEIPKFPLKQLQRTILEGILNRVPPHDAAHGFRPGHSAITNAASHCGREVVVKFDLTDFFPSVPASRVVRTLRTIGYPETVARLLAGLCTTRVPADVWNARPNPPLDGSNHVTRLRFAERHLPQGAPTSPALANLAACRLDRRLTGLATKINSTYTRYADDLTFSGGGALSRCVARLGQLVAIIAGEEGFTLNFRKTRVMRRGTRQTVTGIVVNAKPNAPRADFDQLKAILTNCARHGPASQNRDNRPDFRAHLAGRVAHLAAINPVRGRKLWALFDAIVWGE